MKINFEQKHFQWGITAFLVIVCSILVFFGIYRFDGVGDFFSLIVSILAPFIYGIVMAYLLCPIYNFSVSGFYRLMNKGKYKFKYDLAVSKVMGTLISLIILVVVIVGVLSMILPGLVDNLIKVVEMLPEGIEKFKAWVDVKFANVPWAKNSIDDWSDDMANQIIDFVTGTLIPNTGSMAVAISTTLLEALGALIDFIIGIIVCVYFLNIKDTLAAQTKKLILALFSESKAEDILSGANYTNKTFGGFISGKLIDSAIIGIICFIFMTLFGWEYSLLISCIIGITNIIPFFGPFIGAVPSALLLLMVNPTHCIYFVIFIIILQQFDGNILGPKILGDSTGLASFWVLFAVLVGGGLFGFIGMILGIPVFAVLYALTSRALNQRLEKKGLSSDTLDYKVDVYRTYKPKKKGKKKAKAAKGGYTADQVTATTREELEEAREKGHEIMEATLVEYHDEEIDEEETDIKGTDVEGTDIEGTGEKTK